MFLRSEFLRAMGHDRDTKKCSRGHMRPTGSRRFQYEDDDDTNVDSEKELSLEQKLELVIAKKFQQTKIQYRNQLCPEPSDEKSNYLKMRDLEDTFSVLLNFLEIFGFLETV
ncbi:hypothetical protein TNCV_3674231 [Trichonephila clavipes]|nr:hypothetical protein TNCV_3674231 [Trichonephila clavipes]